MLFKTDGEVVWQLINHHWTTNAFFPNETMSGYTTMIFSFDDGEFEMKCIDLKKQFGERYRIEYEESYLADRGDGARAKDPWLYVIRGKFGHVYPHGKSTLTVSVDGHPNIAAKFRRLKYLTVIQDGDDGELTAIFDVDNFERIAIIMKLRRRPRLSSEQRIRMAERMRRLREKVHNSRENGEGSSPKCVPETSPV